MATKYAQKINIDGIEFYQVGANRYVVHYLEIPILESEYNAFTNYKTALNKSRILGGKVYTAKWFGGGIAFETTDLNKLAKGIKNL